MSSSVLFEFLDKRQNFDINLKKRRNDIEMEGIRAWLLKEYFYFNKIRTCYN